MKELKDLILSSGADLVGFADLNGINKINEMPYGVFVAVKIPAQIIMSIHDGPNISYFDEYNRINDLLNKIVTTGAQFLINNGYKAHAQTSTMVIKNDNFETELPHKTIGTRSGLGWIGKSALFVTKEYGSGIRISSFLTNAELDCGKPIEESFCGDCVECVKYCPGGAITGKLWNVKTERCEIFDAKKCADTAKAITMEKMNKKLTICGKCIEICPYTKKYINKEKT
ncbi:MAG: hypothetical protein FWD47_15130 [Treponema sp.]|nr:hypothetical protein [Treponema sp.]